MLLMTVINEKGAMNLPRMKLPHRSPFLLSVVQSSNKWFASFISRCFNNGDSSGNIRTAFLIVCLWSWLLMKCHSIAMIHEEHTELNMWGEQKRSDVRHKINKSLNLQAHSHTDSALASVLESWMKIKTTNFLPFSLVVVF